MANKLVRIVDGILYKKKNGKREGYTTLQDALNDQAICGCGIYCCDGDNKIVLTAQDTGVAYYIYASGGNLVLENSKDGTSQIIVALPSA